MTDGPLFTIDCEGCGRRGTTSRLTELWTVRYCPDCRTRMESSPDRSQSTDG